MDGVGKVSQVAREGKYLVNVDHKTGFHHLPLDPESWTYFWFVSERRVPRVDRAMLWLVLVSLHLPHVILGSRTTLKSTRRASTAGL